METGSCSRRCMPSLRSKATQRRRKNVQGSGYGEWALSAAWRQKHRAAHAGRARTVATGSPRAWLPHGRSESRTGRGASQNANASIAPAGSKVGVTEFDLVRNQHLDDRERAWRRVRKCRRQLGSDPDGLGQPYPEKPAGMLPSRYAWLLDRLAAAEDDLGLPLTLGGPRFAYRPDRHRLGGRP